MTTIAELIDVRYENHADGGGSIWVRMLHKFCRSPGDTWDDYWVCIWSTAGGNPGSALPATTQDFMAATRSGPGIPNPYSHPVEHAPTTMDPASAAEPAGAPS